MLRECAPIARCLRRVPRQKQRWQGSGRALGRDRTERRGAYRTVTASLKVSAAGWFGYDGVKSPKVTDVLPLPTAS